MNLVLLYAIYAVVQAIITLRVLRTLFRDEPRFALVFLCLFAPFITIALILECIEAFCEWIVRD
jgi:hypothetical protein